MQKTVYEDYKYCMQDTSKLYIGCKYTFGEMLENEEIMFKFRLIVERYLLPEIDMEDTLESHLYYLTDKSLAAKIYKQMKARIKIDIIEEKKNLFGKTKKEYVNKIVTIDELVAMSPKEKEAKGVVVQELGVSKLALLSF